ncbi:MAG TPA: hypothetical protein VM759_03965 [Longimicrobium sp.]|jgi:hypothetical protein|nr:hypothetical protein [Longimicrobium sp.]
MTEFANRPPSPEPGRDRSSEVEAFLERARTTVARTREVIRATRERLGLPPDDAPGEE